MAPGARDHIFCSSLTFFQLEKSLRRTLKMVGSTETDQKGARETHAHLSEVEGLALTYKRMPGVDNRDPRRKDLLHASVAENAIRF